MKIFCKINYRYVHVEKFQMQRLLKVEVSYKQDKDGFKNIDGSYLQIYHNYNFEL